MALKINNCDFDNHDAAKYEVKMCRRLAEGDRRHDGYRFVRTILDDFETKGSRGMHVCLVYEPLRETLSLFQMRSHLGKFPLPLLKGCVRLLLMGLDFLHSECQMVHTGKLEICM